MTIFKNVLDQIHAINSHQQLNSDKFIDLKPFHIIVFPNVLHTFEVFLEEEGLFGFVELHRFSWDFITIDTGILTLEIPQIFREVFIQEDTSLLSSLAESIKILNIVSKKPNIILTYGDNAKIIANMVDRIEATRGKPVQNGTSDFGAMIIVDRNKDYPSGLLTPVIYSGLLLELFHAQSGTLVIDEANNRIKSEKLQFLKIKPKKEAQNTKETNLRLNDKVDTIYQENRYKHFSEVINLLSSQAKNLGTEGRNIQGMQINEIHEYVATKLPRVATQKKELFKHLILCESIVNELGGNFEQLQNLEEAMLFSRNKKQTFQKIQELLTTDGHRFHALRYICLLYLTSGLTADETTAFITNYLNAFGYQYLPVFSHLATAKLFPDLPSLSKTKILTNISLPKWQNQFQIEVNKFNLLPADSNNEAENVAQTRRRDPACPSYVFNGSYIPLVAQIASVLLNATKFDDVCEKLGHTDQLLLHKYLAQEKINLKEASAIIKRDELHDEFPLKIRNLFIFVVGGVTYAEIAACSLIERLTHSRIFLSSNCILSGNDIVEAAFS